MTLRDAEAGVLRGLGTATVTLGTEPLGDVQTTWLEGEITVGTDPGRTRGHCRKSTCEEAKRAQSTAGTKNPAFWNSPEPAKPCQPTPCEEETRYSTETGPDS